MLLLLKINHYIGGLRMAFIAKKLVIYRTALCLSIVLLIRILLQFIELLWALRYPSLMANDASVYLSLGHGIMNGLKIYKDIFEIKPPGIFLISALSVLVSKGPALALIIQMIFYISIPLLLVWISKRTLLDTVLALIFGLAIAVFAADRTNGLQPECYGTFFSLLFLICLYKKKTALSALPLLAAIWMKEPFLLSIFAAVLILADDVKFIIKRFFLPLVVAGLIALVLLLISGTLHDYFFSYLSEIFSGRLNYSREFGFANMPSYFISQPIWIRGFMFRKLIEELPWFHFIIPFFFFSSFYLKKGKKIFVPIGILSLCIGLFLFRRTEVMYDLLSLLHFTLPIHDAFFRNLLLEYIAIVFALLSCLTFLFIKAKPIFFYTLFLLLAAYCTTLSVSIGGSFNWHHFAFATPAYISLFFLYQQSTEKWKILFGILIVLMAFTKPKMPIEKRIESQLSVRSMTSSNKEYAARVDKIMDECHFDRYMVWIKELNVAAFTRHSPLEFYYVQLAGFSGYSEGPIKKWKARYIDSMYKAPLFVTDNLSDVPEEIQNILDNEFTNVPPACAKNTKNISVFFKNTN